MKIIKDIQNYYKIKNFNKFMIHVFSTCIKNRISLKFLHKTQIESDGCMISGWFTGERNAKELAIATKNKKHIWVGVLVHEFSHLEQHLHKVKAWKNLQKIKQKGRDACDLYFDWLEGCRISTNTGIKCGKLVQAMELDCEKRAVENIKKWKLDKIVNIDKYIQSANAYIYFYTWSFTSRKWSNVKSPYKDKKIMGLMPIHFLDDYTKLPKGLKKLFEKCC